MNGAKSLLFNISSHFRNLEILAAGMPILGRYAGLDPVFFRELERSTQDRGIKAVQ